MKKSWKHAVFDSTANKAQGHGTMINAIDNTGNVGIDTSQDGAVVGGASGTNGQNQG